VLLPSVDRRRSKSDARAWILPIAFLHEFPLFLEWDFFFVFFSLGVDLHSLNHVSTFTVDDLQLQTSMTGCVHAAAAAASHRFIGIERLVDFLTRSSW
jgi:hypothetical protein